MTLIRNMVYTQRLLRKLTLIVAALYLLFAATYLFYDHAEQTRVQQQEFTRQMQTACERVALAYNECSQLADALCGNSVLLEYLLAKPDDISELVGFRFRLNAVKTNLGTSYPGLAFRVYALEETVAPIEFLRPGAELPEEVLNYALGADLPQLRIGDTGETLHLYWPCDQLRGVRLVRAAVVEVIFPIVRLEPIFQDMINRGDPVVLLMAGEQTVEVTGEGAADGRIQIAQDIFATPKWFYVGESQQNVSNARVCSFAASFHTQIEYGPILGSGLVLVALLLALIAMTLRISNRLLRQVEWVIDSVDVTSRDEDELPTHAENEFDYIRLRLHQMVEKLNERHQKLQAQMVETKEIETQLLQDLINPHFLYNTLEGIRWVCGDPRVSQVIDEMIVFYRHSLNRGMLYLPLEKELNLLQAYADVQRFAYDSEFRLEIDVPEALMDVPVIKFILQPFVENALLHGIDKREDAGCITVSARAEEGRMTLTVEDNGCGMSPEVLEGVENGCGYGICNVRRRVRNIYGEDGSVRIESELGRGTRVVIGLPVREDPADDA